jgi:hypothetical protein
VSINIAVIYYALLAINSIKHVPHLWSGCVVLIPLLQSCRTYGSKKKNLRMGENNDNQLAVKVRRTYSFVVNKPSTFINAVGVAPKLLYDYDKVKSSDY